MGVLLLQSTMNTNKIIGKVAVPLQEVHLEFNQNWIVSRSVALAAIAVASVFAVKTYKKFSQERLVAQGAEQMLKDQEADVAQTLGSLILHAETEV